MNHTQSSYPTSAAGGGNATTSRRSDVVDSSRPPQQQQQQRHRHFHGSSTSNSSSIIHDVSTREYYRRLAISYLVIPTVLASIPFLIHVCMTLLYTLSGGSRIAASTSIQYLIWMGLMGIVFMVTKHISRYLIVTYAPTPEICDKTLERTCNSFTSSIKRICWSSLILRFMVYPMITFILPSSFMLSSQQQQQSSQSLLLWNQFWKCAFDTTIPFGGCMFVSFMMVSVVGYIKHCSRRFSLVKCSLQPLLNNPYTSQIPILLNSWNKFNREWNTIQHSHPFFNKNNVVSPMSGASNPRTTTNDISSALVARQHTSGGGGPLVPAHSPFVSTQERRSPRTGGSSTSTSATKPFSLFKTQPLSSSPAQQRSPVPGSTMTPINSRTNVSSSVNNNRDTSSIYKNGEATTYPPLWMALFHLVIYMVCGAIFGVALRNAIGLILLVPIAIPWMKTSMAFVGALCFACVWCQEYLLFSTEKTTPFEINPSQYPKFQYVAPSKHLNAKNVPNASTNASVGTFLQTNVIEKVSIDLKQYIIENHPLWWKRLILFMLTGSPLIGAWMFYFVLPWTTSYDDATIDNHHGEEEVSSSIIQQWCPTKLYFLMSLVLCPSVSTTMMTLLEIVMGYIIFMTGITYMRMIDTINHVAICQPISLTALSQVEENEETYRQSHVHTTGGIHKHNMEQRQSPPSGGTILPTSLMESFDYLPSHIKFFLRLMCDLDVTTTSVSYISRSRGSPMSPSSSSLLYDANQTSIEQIIHYLLMESHSMTYSGIDSLEAKELKICNDLIHTLTDRLSLVGSMRNNCSSSTSRNVMKLLVLESLGGVVNDATKDVVSTSLFAASLRHQFTIEHMLQHKYGSLAIVRTLIAMATISIHDMEDVIQSTIQTTKLISNSNNDVLLQQPQQQQLCVSPGQMYQMEMCLRGAARMIGTVLAQSSSSKQDYSTSSVGRHSMVSLCVLPLMKVAHKLHVTTLQLINELIALQQVELNTSSSGSDDNDNGRNPASTRQQQQQQQLVASKVIATIAQKDSTGLYHTFCFMELEQPQLMNMFMSSSDGGMSLLKLLVVADEAAYLIWTRLQTTNDISKQERILKQLTPECQRWLYDLLQRVKKE